MLENPEMAEHAFFYFRDPAYAAAHPGFTEESPALREKLIQLKRDIRLPEAIEVGEDYGTVIWAVEAIWHGYAGWFHYRSTTELYGVPAHLAYAEIAKLAGPAALGKRAETLVANSEHTARRFRDANHALATRPIRICHLGAAPGAPASRRPRPR